MQHFSAFPLSQKCRYVQIRRLKTSDNPFLGSYQAATSQWAANFHYTEEQNLNISEKRKKKTMELLHTQVSESQTLPSVFVRRARTAPCWTGWSTGSSGGGHRWCGESGLRRPHTRIMQDCALGSSTDFHHSVSNSDIAYRYIVSGEYDAKQS